MINQQIPVYFEKIDQAVQAVKKQEQVSSRAALVAVLAFLNHQTKTDNSLNNATIANQPALAELGQLEWLSLSFSDRRNILQLLLLNADRKDQVPVNLQLTPDGIGYLLGELIYQSSQVDENSIVTDMVVGTGNLLWTVAESLQRHGFMPTSLLGLDNDEGQLDLATEVARALGQDQTLFLGDVLELSGEDLAPAMADIVVGDLPVGYYPKPTPKNFVTAFPDEDGQSYAHYMMIEKSLELVKDGGWIYLVVPQDLLTGSKHEAVLKLFSQKAQLKAFLSLPKEYFQKQGQAKAFLVLRKAGESSNQEVLMGQYPSVKDTKALQEFLQDIQAWGKLK